MRKIVAKDLTKSIIVNQHLQKLLKELSLCL